MDNRTNYENIRQSAYEKSSGKMIPIAELNRFKQSVARETSKIQLKYRILIVVVAAVTTISSHMIKDGIDRVKMAELLDTETAPYVQVIQDNTHRTNDNTHYWVDSREIGRNFSELESEDEKHLAIYSFYNWHQGKNLEPGIDFDVAVKNAFNGEYSDSNDYFSRSLGLDTSKEDFEDNYKKIIESMAVVLDAKNSGEQNLGGTKK